MSEAVGELECDSSLAGTVQLIVTKMWNATKLHYKRPQWVFTFGCLFQMSDLVNQEKIRYGQVNQGVVKAIHAWRKLHLEKYKLA
jgi:hypothetical protein